MKGNRQGSLSRWIKQPFETFSEFQKVRQPVEKTFRQAEERRPRRASAPVFSFKRPQRRRGDCPSAGGRCPPGSGPAPPEAGAPGGE
ncbi:hypothetical protein ADH75_10280 [Flavonifractor plautii]|nr:hypothetical protein A4U99_18220 [Flavonifractor plautii]OXE46558.1 hypothetical protein ADH75_10280 [Flavonifractor plautii]